MALLVGQSIFAQTTKYEVQSDSNFYFYYGIEGLAPNVGRPQPTLAVYNTRFTYTKEQKGDQGNSRKKKELISQGFIRQNSIDSMLNIVDGLEDSTVYSSNECILSGAIIHIYIAHGRDTTKFVLHNTIDAKALKLIEVLNPYLPTGKKLYGSEKDIINQEKCLTYIMNMAKALSKDSIIIKQ